MWINIKNSEIQNDKQRICKVHVGLFHEVLISTLKAFFFNWNCWYNVVLIFRVDNLQKYQWNGRHKPSAHSNNSVY
jgi:hypothetical protein